MFKKITNFIESNKMNRKDEITNNLQYIFSDIIVKYDYYLQGVIDVNLRARGFEQLLITLKNDIIVTYSSDNYIRVIAPQKTFRIKSRMIYPTQMISLPDGKVAIIGGSSQIQIIDVYNQEYEMIFKGHTQIVLRFFVLEGNKVLSADNGSTILIWDYITGEIYDELKVQGHGVVLLSNNKIAVRVKSDIQIINLHTHEVEFTLSKQGEDISKMYFLNNNKLLSISRDSVPQIHIWDLKTKKLDTLFKNYYFGSYLTVVNNDYIMGIKNGQQLIFRNIHTGLCDYVHSRHKARDYGQDIILPDGRLAVVWGNEILIFQLNGVRGKYIDIQPDLVLDAGYEIVHIALLPDGRIVSASHDEDEEDKKLIIWR